MRLALRQIIAGAIAVGLFSTAPSMAQNPPSIGATEPCAQLSGGNSCQTIVMSNLTIRDVEFPARNANRPWVSVKFTAQGYGQFNLIALMLNSADQLRAWGLTPQTLRVGSVINRVEFSVALHSTGLFGVGVPVYIVIDNRCYGQCPA